MSDELDDKVTAFVQDVMDAMELAVQVTLDETPDHLRLDITGDGVDVLLRRDAEALDALQVIVNTVFRRDVRGDRHYVIDALGYRKNKDAELRQTVRDLMERAKITNVPQEIGPLNPYARRIVHLAVAEDTALSSESIGDAFLKTVAISRVR
jgi:spoIIIJ-associated protein